MYCITDKKIDFLEKLPFHLGAVGHDKFIKIFYLVHKKYYYKEKNYSELTFQYWYWKNKLKFNKMSGLDFVKKDVLVKPNNKH